MATFLHFEEPVSFTHPVYTLSISNVLIPSRNIIPIPHPSTLSCSICSTCCLMFWLCGGAGRKTFRSLGNQLTDDAFKPHHTCCLTDKRWATLPPEHRAADMWMNWWDLSSTYIIIYATQYYYKYTKLFPVKCINKKPAKIEQHCWKPCYKSIPQ